MRVLGPQNSQGVVTNAGHEYSWLRYVCVCVCRYILLLVISVGVVEDYMSRLECPQPYMRGCSHCGRIRGDLGREGVGQGLQVGSQEPVLPNCEIYL